jgi:serine phosphatase RsbU (regulator of sigma subunit)
LADVAGHGLAGAIGTVPLSSTFYRSAKADLPLSTSVGQINDELRATLPPRLFCAVLAFELDPERRALTVINCGMPDAEVLLPDGTLRHLESQNVPLGIIEGIAPVAHRLEVAAGTRVFAMSDGAIECVDGAGAMLGVERLRQVLQSSERARGFDAVLETVRSFTGGNHSDDVSVMEVVV